MITRWAQLPERFDFSPFADSPSHTLLVYSIDYGDDQGDIFPPRFNLFEP